MIGEPCTECGEGLAPDQRYCINCGHRVEAPLAPSYLPGSLERGEVRRGFPMPIPIAGTFAAVALGFGIVMGTALTPNLSGLVAGEHVDGPTVAVTPPDDGKGSKSKGGKGGGGGGSGTQFDSGTSYGGSFGSGFYGTTGTTTGTGTDTGTGGVPPPHNKPKPDATYVSGTVVHTNPVAGSYAIASSSGGALIPIHAKTLPSIGVKLKVPVRVLANGTNAEDGGREKKGNASSAKFTGIVTDSRDGLLPSDPDVYTVSSKGSSVLVFGPNLTPEIAVGTVVASTVEIRTSVPTAIPPGHVVAGCPAPPIPFPNPAIFPGKQLFQTTAESLGSSANAVIETVGQSTCPPSPGTTGAVISTDDIRQGSSDLFLPTSPGLDPTRLTPGKAAMASVSIAAGALTEITGTASDQGIAGADSTDSGQGGLARAARAADRKIAKARARNARR